MPWRGILQENQDYISIDKADKKIKWNEPEKIHNSHSFPHLSSILATSKLFIFMFTTSGFKVA